MIRFTEVSVRHTTRTAPAQIEFLATAAHVQQSRFLESNSRVFHQIGLAASADLLGISSIGTGRSTSSSETREYRERSNALPVSVRHESSHAPPPPRAHVGV